MAIKFIPIGSGSSGNCIFVGTDNTKVLIDVGLSGKKVEQALQSININIQEIDAILVTHEHSDHIEGVGIISRRYDLPIYATTGTWDSMNNKLGQIPKRNKKLIYPSEKFILNDLAIYPFLVPHDAKEPVCYSMFYKNYKIAILTDLGHITQEVIDNVRHCNLLFLECNHDENMLKNSSYPYKLKQRILGDYGHISNETAGKVLACIFNQNLKNIFLGHLSKENNTPELAYLTVSNILDEFHIKVNVHTKIYIANEYGIKDIVILE